jgi:hypothetical protein
MARRAAAARVRTYYPRHVMGKRGDDAGRVAIGGGSMPVRNGTEPATMWVLALSPERLAAM